MCALQVLLNCYLPDLSDFLKQAWASILGAPTLSPKQRCCRPFRSAVPGSAAAASTGTRSKCTFSAPSSPAPDGLDQKLWGGLRGQRVNKLCGDSDPRSALRSPALLVTALDAFHRFRNNGEACGSSCQNIFKYPRQNTQITNKVGYVEIPLSKY